MPDDDDENETVLVDLTEKDRNQRGRDLAQALARWYDLKAKTRNAKAEMKAQETKLEMEVQRLSRAVMSGREEIPAQEEMFEEEAETDA